MLKSHFESQLRSCRSASLAYPSAYSHVTSSHVTPGIANWRLIRKRRRSKRGRKKQETAIIIVTEGRTSYRYVPTQTIWNLHNIIIALWDKPKFATYPPSQWKKWVDRSRIRSMMSSLWAQAQSVSFSVWVWLERGLRYWFSKPRKKLFQVQELWCKSAILFIHSFVFFFFFEIALNESLE